jgi:hypothetical protein
MNCLRLRACIVSRIGILAILSPLIVLTLIGELSACVHTSWVLPRAGEVTVGVQGTVKFINVEGGCWLLDTRYGRLSPTNLDKEFRVDGLKIIASVRRRVDIATFCPVGEAIVTISQIAKVGT